MYAQTEPKVQLRMLLGAGFIIISLLALAACDIGNQPNPASTDNRSSLGAAATSPLPTPVETPDQGAINAQATQVAQRMAATPVSLVNASPEQIGQLAVEFARGHHTIRSGEPQVLLTRPTTLHELTAMGLGEHDVESIERPPLMLVLLKGDFYPFPKPGADESSSADQHITYVAYVYDLWGGTPLIIQESKDGGIFKKVLNDPTLPDATPLSSLDDAKKRTNQQQGPKVLHYGDTAIGGEPISGHIVHQANFTAWSYIAKAGTANLTNVEGSPVGTNQIYVTINHDWNSVNGDQEYINANKKLLPQIATQSGQVEVSIVFNTYVPVDQFRVFAQTHKLNVLSSYVRAIDQAAKPIYAPYYTLHINSSGNGANPIPQANLDNELAAISNSPQKQVSLAGVYCTHASVDAKELPVIAAEPSVYYVDVTAEAVRNDLKSAGIDGASNAVVMNYAYVFFSLVEPRYQLK